MKQIIKENKLFITILILIVVLFNIKLPYYVNAPGGTININNRIEYKEKKEYNGSLNMLYVTEYIATPPTYLASFLLPDWDLENISESRVSNETTDEIEYRNKIMLENSINNAKYIAYKEAGEEIEVTSKKTVVIATTIKNGFKIGDEILEVNNKPVDDINTIKEEIKKHEVGEFIHFKIKRKKKEKNLKIEIKNQEGNKILGVMIVTNQKYKTSKEIELNFKM